MVQSLKVDIIYHLSPSDFEMEFNLNGRCHMRLLSCKTSDKKGFIKALARGVARSRIIITCGHLFGADGLISTVATAIGNGTALCDNKTYGINGEEPIHIINGSTPLVTPDGYFGGCIIESGPQTIILLTENKAFRKSIMQNLIHPYVEEISYIPTKISPVHTPSAESEPVFEDAVSEDENYLVEPDDYESESEDLTEALPSAQDEHNIEFIMDGEGEDEQSETVEESVSAPAFDNNYNLMYTEVESEDDIKSRYNEPYKPSESDSLFIAAPETDEEEIRNKKKNNMRAMDITIVVLVLLLLLAILALVYFIVLKPMTMGISTGDYIKEIFGLASNSTLV